MTIDDHTAAKATLAITSGISDLREMMAIGRPEPVRAELQELTQALFRLGNLIASLNLQEIK